MKSKSSKVPRAFSLNFYLTWSAFSRADIKIQDQLLFRVRICMLSHYRAKYDHFDYSVIKNMVKNDRICCYEHVYTVTQSLRLPQQHPLYKKKSLDFVFMTTHFFLS